MDGTAHLQPGLRNPRTGPGSAGGASWAARSVWMRSRLALAGSWAALWPEQTGRRSCDRLENLPAASCPLAGSPVTQHQSQVRGRAGVHCQAGHLRAPRPAAPAKLLLPLAGGCCFWPHPPGHGYAGGWESGERISNTVTAETPYSVKGTFSPSSDPQPLRSSSPRKEKPRLQE